MHQFFSPVCSAVHVRIFCETSQWVTFLHGEPLQLRLCPPSTSKPARFVVQAAQGVVGQQLSLIPTCVFVCCCMRAPDHCTHFRQPVHLHVVLPETSCSEQSYRISVIYTHVDQVHEMPSALYIGYTAVVLKLSFRAPHEVISVCVHQGGVLWVACRYLVITRSTGARCGVKLYPCHLSVGIIYVWVGFVCQGLYI